MNYKIQTNSNNSDFNNYVAKWKTLFYVLLIIGTLTVIAGGILTSISNRVGYIMIACGIIFIGITVILFPFATPQTNKLIGIGKGKTIVRLFGIFLIVLGVIFFFIK